MITKKDQIIHLLEHTDKTNREIADEVGCLDAYVRVVQQRLAGGGDTESNRRYQRNRWASDPEFRERRRKYMIEWHAARRRDHEPV